MSALAGHLAEPIPMLLACPSCHERHIDLGEFVTKPHHTHACQSCGMVWRPAIVPTLGVRFLPGFKNDDSVVEFRADGLNCCDVCNETFQIVCEGCKGEICDECAPSDSEGVRFCQVCWDELVEEAKRERSKKVRKRTVSQ